MEYKTFSAEMKATGDYTFTGYGSTFLGEPDSYNDIIMPGAFTDTLANRDRPIMMKYNHFSDVIGRYTTAKQDDKGLYLEGKLSKGHSTAEDVYANMKNDAVTGLSIGFMIPQGGSEVGADGIRRISQIDLVEVSLTPTPANLSAQVSSVKSALDAAGSLREVEQILREANGFSRAEAFALVQRIKCLTVDDEKDKAPSIDEIRKAIREGFENNKQHLYSIG